MTKESKKLKLLKKLKKKSIGWWSLVITIIGVIIALAAWLLPEPFNIFSNKPPTKAEQLGIMKKIPEKDPGITRILVMQFDEVEETNYRVTDMLLADLRDAIKPYSDTEVIFSERLVTEKEGSDIAIEIGELYEASIVIWGWYGLTEDAVPLGVHFEIIQDSGIFQTNTCAASTAKVAQSSPAELSNLTLQTTLSNELTYITLFTLGLARFESADWEIAEELFDDAIEQFSEDTNISAETRGEILIDNLDLLHYYRSKAYIAQEKYDQGITEIEALDESWHSVPSVIGLLGISYDEQGQHELAIEKFTEIIENDFPVLDKAQAYYQRGLSYNNQSMYELANQDFIQALKLDEDLVLALFVQEDPQAMVDHATEILSENPDHILARFERGVGYYNLYENLDQVIQDFSHALEIYPEFLPALEYRSVGYLLAKEQPDHSINAYSDLEKLLQHEKYQTPCNYINYAFTYDRLGNEELSIFYTEKAAGLATEEISDDSSNAYAYYVRALANDALGKNIPAFMDSFQSYRLDPSLGNFLGLDQISSWYWVRNNLRVYAITFILVAILVYLFRDNLVNGVKVIYQKLSYRLRRKERDA